MLSVALGTFIILGHRVLRSYRTVSVAHTSSKSSSPLGTKKFQERNYFWNSYILLRQDDRSDAYDISFAPLSGARQTKLELEDDEAGEEELQRRDEEDEEREQVAPRIAGELTRPRCDRYDDQRYG